MIKFTSVFWSTFFLMDLSACPPPGSEKGMAYGFITVPSMVRSVG